MRKGIQTDHEFELSPYCDCDNCNVFCHYHYGLDCGPTSAEDSILDQCSKCGAIVYPTIGSHARARREGVPLVCMDCWRKLEDCEFGGVMDHGKILSAKAVEEMIAKVIRGERQDGEKAGN